MTAIAYFVSSHGFGHAARAAAVIQALHERAPNLRFAIFTQAPSWLFAESLTGSLQRFECDTDVGLVQKNSLTEDLPATLARLSAFYPLDQGRLLALARQITALGCEIVLCDIAPLGIAVAAAAGVPSVLIENFTWDWIYAGYADQHPALNPTIRHLSGLFAAADHHIQAQPICLPDPTALQVPPIARQPRTAPPLVRAQLGFDEHTPLALLTMGGTLWDYNSLHGLHRFPANFLIPGGSESGRRQGNVLFLPANSGFYHPDLINASDVVIGKLGYSTVAEAYHAGIPFGYVGRTHFRESQVVQAFVEQHMVGAPISAEAFADGSWLNALPALLALPRVEQATAHGASKVAEFVCNLLR